MCGNSVVFFLIFTLTDKKKLNVLCQIQTNQGTLHENLQFRAVDRH